MIEQGPCLKFESMDAWTIFSCTIATLDTLLSFLTVKERNNGQKVWEYQKYLSTLKIMGPEAPTCTHNDRAPVGRKFR